LALIVIVMFFITMFVLGMFAMSKLV